MKNLGDGRWQCPACRTILAVGDPSLPRYRRNCCNTCQAQRVTAHRYATPVVNYLPPITRNTVARAAAARRKLEELADQRSVEF